MSSFLVSGKAQKNSPTAAGTVDILKYAGRWFDIASIPARFQKDCYCTTADYSILPNGTVEVVNRCRKGSPEARQRMIRGKAFPVEGSRNTKLRVRFFWPFLADYWIVELDPDYSWAAVSTPSKRYLWLLSRSPVMKEELFNQIISLLQDKGYDTGKLRRTPQTCN